jgi:hypothetical protein
MGWDDIWCRPGRMMAVPVHGFFFQTGMNAILRRVGVLLDECGRFEPGLVIGDSSRVDVFSRSVFQ